MIRPLTSTDTDECFAIYEAAFRDLAFPIGPRWSRAQFGEAAKSGLISVVDDRVAAFVLFDDVAAALEVSMLATHRDHLRAGLMSRLLEQMVERAQDRPVWLEVHEQNLAARGLYVHLGFQEVGRRPRYYSDGGAAILYSHGG